MNEEKTVEGINEFRWHILPDIGNYDILYEALTDAYQRAASGKGKERHGEGKPFDQQFIMVGGKRWGVGALLYQAEKKLQESAGLEYPNNRNELLDSIVYLAAACILLKNEYGPKEIIKSEQGILQYRDHPKEK